MNIVQAPIQTAIASFGMSGKIFHAPAINHHKGFSLDTILERSSDKSKDKYPSVTVAKSFEEILNDPKIELVVINTPNEFHFPMTKACLHAGKHVVVEKPFTIITTEGLALVKIARDQNLILSVYHSKRFETDFLTVKSILDKGLVGKPVELHWHYDRYRTHITHKKWKEDNLPGSGVLYDLGVHLIDSTLQLFGMPETVTCHTRSIRDGASSPDYFHMRLGYGTMDAYLHSNIMTLQKGANIALHGTTGSYLKYGTDPQEEQLKTGLTASDSAYGIENPEEYGTLTSILNQEINTEKYKSVDASYVDFYDGIFNAIRHHKPNPVPPEQAAQNIRIIEYAMQSNNEGRTINI